MKIVASGGNLNAISLDDLFSSISSLHSIKPGTAPKVEVDLGSIQFVDPHGAVGLIILLETIARRSKAKPHLIVPRSSNVCGYLARLGVLSEVGNLAELDWDTISNGATVGDSDVLLELTAIQSQGDVDSVLRHLEDILTSNLGWTTIQGGPAFSPILKAMVPADIERLKSRLRACLPASADGRITLGARANAVKGRVTKTP